MGIELAESDFKWFLNKLSNGTVGERNKICNVFGQNIEMTFQTISKWPPLSSSMAQLWFQYLLYYEYVTLIWFQYISYYEYVTLETFYVNISGHWKIVMQDSFLDVSFQGWKHNCFCHVLNKFTKYILIYKVHVHICTLHTFEVGWQYSHW